MLVKNKQIVSGNLKKVEPKASDIEMPLIPTDLTPKVNPETKINSKNSSKGLVFQNRE